MWLIFIRIDESQCLNFNQYFLIQTRGLTEDACIKPICSWWCPFSSPLQRKNSVYNSQAFDIVYLYWSEIMDFEVYIEWGNNGHLSLIYKLCSKIPTFWNFLTKCSCFLNSTKSSDRWNSTLAMLSSIHILPLNFFGKFK